jgi:ubiquinone/menaquinone biosynthesis C-methylase UbiE
MINVSLLGKFYESMSETRRLQRSRVGRLEFHTTVTFVEKHISPEDTILELGAGDGTYSLHFSRRGHRVMATDLLPANVQTILAKAESEELRNIQVRQANAIQLADFSEGEFQAVLCLGPYYHLRTRELRRQCLLECRRVVQDAGIVALSYINRSLIVYYLLTTGKQLTPDQYDSLMDPDDLRVDYPDELLNITHFATAKSVEEEVRSCGFEILEHVGTDGPYAFSPSLLGSLDREAYQNFRSHHIKACGQPDASNNCLVILKKA